MKETTIAAITAIISTDETISSEAKARILSSLSDKPQPQPDRECGRVYKRREVQKLFGWRSLASVDNYARRGVFEKVKLGSRGCGFTEESVRRAYNGERNKSPSEIVQ